MNAETLQYHTLKTCAEDERLQNTTSDHAHFYEWMFEYFKNGLIDRDRVLDMLSKRRETILDELLWLNLIVPKSKRITP
jgi:hypothetical protein